MKDNTAKERMKRYRERKRNETVTESPESVTVSPDSVTWETMPIKDIKLILPGHLVKEITALSEYDLIRHRPITLEQRLRIAYKYHLWHEANFVDGVHKDSRLVGA